ncbi:MAG: hypothetical protein J1E63_07010 [Muribaculaceae bacterium]|nr:hypothetical protein [Muribaculaceae bacterium]
MKKVVILRPFPEATIGCSGRGPVMAEACLAGRDPTDERPSPLSPNGRA